MFYWITNRKGMTSSTLQFLRIINDYYSNLLLVLIATISAIVAYREYLLRRRPYVMPEMVFEKQDDKWFFHIMLVNKGEYPAIAKISHAILKIGDEEYPTAFNFETVLSPNERQKLAPIGHINENGRKKILGHEYKSNRMEILVCLDSKALRQKKFKYQTSMEYDVDVTGENPVIKLVKEKME